MDMCQGLNSHYFHIIGDKLINPIVGVYMPIVRIPIKGGRSPIPNIATFDHGTHDGVDVSVASQSPPRRRGCLMPKLLKSQ